MVERLEALETALTQLSARVSVIEAIVSEKCKDTTSAPKGRPLRLPAAQTRPSVSEAPPQDIPPGSVQYWAFATAHGVHPKTFRDQLKRGAVPFIEKSKVSRPSEHERWLRPADQAAAIRFWQSNGTSYTQCEACPHS
jgi:hypothetical protein